MKNQNKYCKANILSFISIFYTEKLISLKRGESFLRAVVMKPAGCYICLLVLLNGRVYMGRIGYVLGPCLHKHIVHCRGT